MLVQRRQQQENTINYGDDYLPTSNARSLSSVTDNSAPLTHHPVLTPLLIPATTENLPEQQQPDMVPVRHENSNKNIALHSILPSAPKKRKFLQDGLVHVKQVGDHF